MWDRSCSHTRRTLMLGREGTRWPARRSSGLEQGEEGKGRREGRRPSEGANPQLSSPRHCPLWGKPCPPPALAPHRMQAFCRWLISFEVCWAPQSPLSRNRLSWISKSLGQVCSEGWPRGSRGWGKMSWAEWAHRLLQSCWAPLPTPGLSPGPALHVNGGGRGEMHL